MKIYNSLTLKKEEFVPIEEGKVRMYVCGPTVYNFIHIGNARPMIVFDTVRRYFEYKGYKVKYVSNYTDVDDKIIAKSNEEGISADEVSKRYIAECETDAKGLNVKKATVHPKATEEIPEMLKMIENLIDKDFAYAANDGTVYYRTRKFASYGKLSHKNIDDLQAGHREIGVVGDSKEDYLDFVLWKPKKEGEPSWESPWCDGRPGWHLECSCMAKKYLGDEIDIHAGGEDLIFPHHENEIAQSEAANEKPFARYWMHNAFLNIDNKKMSKSAGNFFTVRDIAAKYDLNIVRFFMLSAHYRSPLNFSDELMKSAKAGWERINTCGNMLKGIYNGKEDDAFDEEIFKKTDVFVEKFEAAMEDDFNTADAISSIFEYVKFINLEAKEGISPGLAKKLFERLSLLCDILGVLLKEEKGEIDEEIEKLIEARQQARKNKDFAKADEIRDELLAKGIQLKDTREGVTWTRI